MMYTQKGVLDRNSATSQYIPLVRQIANSLYRKINFTYELNDLIQCGMIGLLEALKKYTPKENIKFETYASKRIQGCMLDELRKQDHLNQDDRKKYKEIQNTEQNLINLNKKKPTAVAIAKECGIELQEYYDITYKNQILKFVYSSDNEVECETFIDENKDPEQDLRKKEIAKILNKAVESLTEKEQTVIQLIYVEDFDHKEVAEVLNVSKARISQIHSAALMKLKTQIE